MVKSTILITGGLGCLGGKLSKYLIDLGYQVVVGSSRQDAELPSGLPNCSLVYTDFDNINTLIKACCGVDHVIHLASVNAQKSQDDPQLAIKVSGIGTYNLIQASILSKVEYFLYFSTAHIYGSPLIGEINESTLPKPLHPYAIAHRLAEDFLLEAINSQNIKGSIVRLSNSIGLPLTKEANCWMLFVNDICKQAIVNRRIVIRSNVSSERDFITMDVVCEMTNCFLSNQTTVYYPVFNIGSGISHTLLQMAEIVTNRCEALFGFCPEIVFSENSNSQNLELKYKIDKFINEMNFTINNNLESSIDEVLNFCISEFSKA